MVYLWLILPSGYFVYTLRWLWSNQYLFIYHMPVEKRLYDPRRSDKTCIRGFRESEIQTSPAQLQRLENWNFACSRCIRLSNKPITKALIRLRGCTGWCAPLLFETPKTGFLALRQYMHLVARNPTLLHANNKGAVKPAHPHNVISALDGVIAAKKTKSGIPWAWWEFLQYIKTYWRTWSVHKLSANVISRTTNRNISEVSIYIDSMIFKDQTNQNTPCLRFGLHIVRTWHIKHRLQQMQGFHEKTFSIWTHFPSFQILHDLKSSIFITTQRGFDLKKKFLLLRVACCDQVMCIQHCCLLHCIHLRP